METAIYFIPGILLIGLVTSYTDITKKVIRNNHLLLGFLYGVCIYGYLALSKKAAFDYVLIGLNLIFAITAGYWFYLKNLWEAGDAKLFICFSFLTPSFMTISVFRFSSLLLFFNVGLISFLALMIWEFRFLGKKLRSIKMSDGFVCARKLGLSIAILFSISWILSYLFLRKFQLDHWVAILLMYLGYQGLFWLWSKTQKTRGILLVVLLGGLVLRGWIEPHFFESPAIIMNYLARSIKYSILFMVLNSLFVFDTSKSELSDVSRQVAFAPFMFGGVLLAYTPFAVWLSGFLGRFLR